MGEVEEKVHSSLGGIFPRRRGPDFRRGLYKWPDTPSSNFVQCTHVETDKPQQPIWDLTCVGIVELGSKEKQGLIDCALGAVHLDDRAQFCKFNHLGLLRRALKARTRPRKADDLYHMRNAANVR